MSLAPAPLGARFAACFIDGLVTLGLAQLFGPIGWAACLAYWLLRDGFFEGQSIGKRVMELRVIVRPRGDRCTWGASFARNVLWILPIVNVVMILTTIVYVFRGGPLRHWGDRLADTEVVAGRP